MQFVDGQKIILSELISMLARLGNMSVLWSRKTPDPSWIFPLDRGARLLLSSSLGFTFNFPYLILVFLMTVKKIQLYVTRKVLLTSNFLTIFLTGCNIRSKRIRKKSIFRPFYLFKPYNDLPAEMLLNINFLSTFLPAAICSPVGGRWW